jgi:CheY-like chemotaxis protein/Tfp pilus assembly protein PilZ
MTEESSESVLLADDSQTFLMYIGLLVKRFGYKVFVAKDGLEALKTAKDKKPSVIVLDYMMPKIDGSSLLTMIRKDTELINTPVIAITAYGSTKQELKDLGCCYFLEKPVDISEFYRAIRGCMKIKNKGTNRRKSMRVQSRLKVVIDCQNERCELLASSISDKGIFLRTVAPFNIGTEMYLWFAVDDEDPVELKGKVVYVTRISHDIQSEPGMGIIFLDVPEDIKPRLSRYVFTEITDDLLIEDSSIIGEQSFLEELD